MSFAITKTPMIISGLKGWFDASDILTQTYTGNEVSSWRDKSGNFNDLTQGIASSQPKTLTNSLNNLNTITFDGIDDYMVMPSGLYSICNGNNTTFVVSKRNIESGVANRVINMGVGTSSRYFIAYSNAIGGINYQSSNTTSQNVQINGITNTNFNIICGRRNSTTQGISINGSTEKTNSLGANESGINLGYVGCSLSLTAFLQGQIAELIIYDKALSNTEKIQVEKYLSYKWRVAL